jgi:hypothetical protein
MEWALALGRKTKRADFGKRFARVIIEVCLLFNKFAGHAEIPFA